MPKPTQNHMDEFTRDRGPIRLACENCFRDDCDGIKEIPPGWEGISEEQSLEMSMTTFDSEDDPDPPKDYSVLEWWTHLGLCPDCAAEGVEVR